MRIDGGSLNMTKEKEEEVWKVILGIGGTIASGLALIGGIAVYEGLKYDVRKLVDTSVTDFPVMWNDFTPSSEFNAVAGKGIVFSVLESKKKRDVVFMDYNLDGVLDEVQLVKPFGDRAYITGENVNKWQPAYDVVRRYFSRQSPEVVE